MAAKNFSGRLVTAAGVAISGATVELLVSSAAGTGAQEATTTTAADGTWSFAEATDPSDGYDIKITNDSDIIFRRYLDKLMVSEVTLTDNDNLVFGSSSDATIDYDSTDLVIDPRVVGSGNVKINAGSIDLNNQGSLINVGAAGSDWTVNRLVINPSNSGGTVDLRVANAANTSGSNSQLLALAAGSSSGDPTVQLAETGSHQIGFGVDVSESRFAIANGGVLGTNDVLRITDATPPVITYNTTHPTTTFDYVCEVCGRHEAEMFKCCAIVKWHDDNDDFRAMVLREPGALEYMEKIGVIELTLSNDGEPEVFTKLGPDWMFVGSMAYQNHQKIMELEARLEALLGA